MALSREALGARLAAQLADCFGLPAPADHYTLMEKHATIVPSPGLERPAADTGIAGVWLAGDAAQSPYPSTIEGSVRSGVRAARAIGRASLS